MANTWNEFNLIKLIYKITVKNIFYGYFFYWNNFLLIEIVIKEEKED